MDLAEFVTQAVASGHGSEVPIDIDGDALLGDGPRLTSGGSPG